jgi:CBS domain-containing protein
MDQTIQTLMTRDPLALPATAPIREAARRMRERDVGDVLVLDGEQVCGVVTDRDIVVRAVAEGLDMETTRIDYVCSHAVVSLSPEDSIETATRVMREHSLRRIPVLDKGRAVGILSLGDLAIESLGDRAVEQETNSTLADISAAPPNK